jgi:transcriptional regulator of acetoin/glycerol metabolism
MPSDVPEWRLTLIAPSQALLPIRNDILRSCGLLLPPGATPSTELLASWRRCSDAGLEVNSVPEVNIVTAADLQYRRDEAGFLRHLVLAEIDSLSQQIAGSNFLLAFGDRDGVILDLFEDHRFATSSSGNRIVAGSRWTENICGTNGLGTALATSRAITVSGPDHYFLHFGDISCTASPIRDAWGRVVGVLDASSYFESRQLHTAALLKMATTQIENLLLAHQMRDSVVFVIHPRAEFLGTLSAGMLAFDLSGALLAVNDRASVLLSGLLVLSGTRFEHLFDASFDATVHRLGKGGEVEINDVMGNVLAIRANGALATPVKSWKAVAYAKPVLKKPTNAVDVRIGGQLYVASDPAVEAALRTVAAAVRLNVPLLIHGETGTGKEQLARYAHEVSGRLGTFVAVNCGALPAELFESELFGHQGGSFTGARREDHLGLLVSADGGTLLLDELRELPMSLQSTLLRFLDDQVVRPVGSTRSRKVNVQIVAASHAELDAEVAAGRFRADLMYRLNTVRVVLPPLRERRDFADAVLHVLHGIAPDTGITSSAIDLLASHHWPGNFRELRSVLTRALLASDEPKSILDGFDLVHHVPASKRAGNCSSSALHLGVAELIAREYERTGHNVSRTSRNLEISRTTVYRHLRERSAQ